MTREVQRAVKQEQEHEHEEGEGEPAWWRLIRKGRSRCRRSWGFHLRPPLCWALRSPNHLPAVLESPASPGCTPLGRPHPTAGKASPAPPPPPPSRLFLCKTTPPEAQSKIGGLPTRLEGSASLSVVAANSSPTPVRHNRWQIHCI